MNNNLQIKSPNNLLPSDGEVYYHGKILTNQEADHYYQQLLTKIAWKFDEAIIFGKHIITKRKIAWYAQMPFTYSYSGITRQSLPWTEELLELKSLVEKVSGETYNSCLLNLYHDGNEGVSWHSDGEKELKKNGAIGSLSFGAERKFMFKHKQSKEVISIALASGSLLIMQGSTQTHWQHRLPLSKSIKTPRINLTFRTIVSKE